MDVIFDWNLGNMIYNGFITLRLCGFLFAEIGVVAVSVVLVIGETMEGPGTCRYGGVGYPVNSLKVGPRLLETEVSSTSSEEV